ncbi:MAG: hypothetical protein EP315_00980 [Gammaproteobacteria bacterium]|nr:MAG: hypothetical protein EP315_00980 [Gammaproteobacteria bacterium]
MRTIFLFIMVMNLLMPVQAETDATVFWYEEQEQGTDAVLMRYVVTEDFIRIDNGNVDDDFLLYDHAQKIVYSANHRDETVMVIKHIPWTTPEFSFHHEVKRKPLQGAPTIAGKQVESYRVFAEQTLCADIQLLPDMFVDEMKLFHDYQLTLSGQLVGSLHNTPEEYRTPCYLLHQVYNEGAYYNSGLPIQEWHERGYLRVLKNFTREKVSEALLKIPQHYKQYSPIGGSPAGN